METMYIKYILIYIDKNMMKVPTKQATFVFVDDGIEYLIGRF